MTQHNTRSQTHISTKGSTTPEKETFLPQPNPLSENPLSPSDTNSLWEEVRNFDCAEIEDPSDIDSMTSQAQSRLSELQVLQNGTTSEESPRGLSQVSELEVLQGSTTLEEALRELSPAPQTQHSGNKPNFAQEFKSEKQTQAIATYWKKILSPDFIHVCEQFFPRCKIGDESPAESSRRPSIADESPERGLIVARVHDPRLYPDKKDKSDQPPMDSIWFGISLQSLSDLPRRYFLQFLLQTDGLSPYLNLFAGFLCVKFGDGPLDAIRNSWMRQAKAVLLSHASLYDSKNNQLAFVRSLKFFGYIIKGSEVEIWKMTVDDRQNTK